MINENTTLVTGEYIFTNWEASAKINDKFK